MYQLFQSFTGYIDSISRDIHIPKSIYLYSDYNSTSDVYRGVAWESASSFYTETFPLGYNCGDFTYKPSTRSPLIQDLSSTSAIV